MRVRRCVAALRDVPAALVVVAAFAAPLPVGAATEVLGDLPRRGWLGVQFAPGPDGHPTIAAIIPGGSAEKAGLREGDALLAVDGADTQVPGTIAATLGRMHAGDVAKLRFRREDGEADRKVKFVAMPFEQSDEFDVLYDVVDTGSAKLRSVLLKPPGAKGKLPAILFVQGLQCAPVDEPTGNASTVLQLLHELTRAGYAVMRCEKPGTGDATGPPCSEIDFDEELGGFRAALAKLRGYDFVDSNRIFVFGHSLGGVEAPVLAAETKVRGVMAFGTTVLPWAEYLVDNERRQTRLDPSADLVALETRNRNLSDFLHEVFRKGRPIQDVVAERADFASIVDDYWPDRLHSFGRHLDFYRQLDAANVAEAWSKVEAPVLILYGELDYTVSWPYAEHIVQIVNSKRPGTARAVQIPRTFHAFNIRDSVQQTLEAPWQGPLSEDVVRVTKEWLAEVDAS